MSFFKFKNVHICMYVCISIGIHTYIYKYVHTGIYIVYRTNKYNPYTAWYKNVYVYVKLFIFVLHVGNIFCMLFVYIHYVFLYI